MTLMRWGKGLLVWGLVGALLSALPALLLSLLPAHASGGLVATIAVMLTLGVTPLFALLGVFGAVLWLLARLRGDRF